jgi:hypothetical protein
MNNNTLPSFSSLLFEDPFTKPDDDEEIDSTWGSVCEITTCETRYNAKGEQIFLRAGKKRKIESPPDESSTSALVLTRVFDKKDTIEFTEMEIRSPHIKAALQEVAPNHPGVNFKAQKVVLRNFERHLFCYHEELRQYGKRLQDPIAAQHLDFALQYPYKNLSRKMRDLKKSR